MAIAVVQPPSIVTGTTPLTASFPNTPTSGNLMIALARSTTNSFTNGSIPGWTLATGTQCGGTTFVGLWYKVAGAAESKDVTLTWTSSADTKLIIEEWGGFTGTPTLDKIKNSNYTSAVNSKTSGTTDTTTVAAELCLAGFGCGLISGETWSNSFVLEKRDSATPVFLLGSLVASSTWTAETTLSWGGTARICGGLIATFMGGITDTELVVADCSHAHAADGPVLTQAHTLAVADGAHAHAADVPVLVEHKTLGVADAAHGHGVDGPSLTQAHTLAVSEAAHGHAADSPVLVSHDELEVDDALHAHSTLGEGLPYTGIPDIGAYEYQPSGLELEQGHLLAVADALHAQAADSPVLTQVQILAIADALHGHGSDTPALAQAHILAVANALHGHESEVPALIQALALAVADAVHGHSADAPVLTQVHVLVVADAFHTHLSGGLVISSPDADFAVFWDGWTGDIIWTESEVEIAVEDLMTGVI